MVAYAMTARQSYEQMHSKTYNLERSQVGAAGASTSAVLKLFKQKRDPLGDRGKMSRYSAIVRSSP